MTFPLQRALVVPAAVLATLLAAAGPGPAEPRSEVRAVRLHAHPTGVDVEIESAGAPTWTARKRGEEILEIRLAASRPAPDLADLVRPEGLVASVRVDVPEEDATRVTIATRGPVANAIIAAPGLLRVRLRPIARTGLATADSWVVAAEPCLNLRAEPRQTGRVVACLAAATPVGVVGSTPGWKRVRTASGAEGWASDAFLHPPVEGSAVPPGEATPLAPTAGAEPDAADPRLAELEAELERLRAELAAERERASELAAELARLRAESELDGEAPAVGTPAAASPLAPLEPIASPAPADEQEKAPDAKPPVDEGGGQRKPRRDRPAPSGPGMP